MSRTQKLIDEPNPVNLKRQCIHLSTWLAASPFLALLLALNCRGELKLSDSVCDHGWPATFLEREGQDLGKWHLTDGHPLLDAGGLAVDMATGILLYSLVLAALEFRRRRHSLLRFSLPDLFALMTIAATGLAWWNYHRTRGQAEQRTVAMLRGHDCSMYVDNTAPIWLARLVGREFLPFFNRATTLRWPPGVEDATVIELCADQRALQSVEYMSFESANVSDVGLSVAVNSRAIVAMNIKQTEVTGTGLKDLRSGWALSNNP